jgi:hypothetical protein
VLGIDGPIITGCEKKPDAYDIAVADGHEDVIHAWIYER